MRLNRYGKIMHPYIIISNHMTPLIMRSTFLLTALLSTMRFLLINPLVGCIVPKSLSSSSIFYNPLATFYGPLSERCLGLPNLLAQLLETRSCQVGREQWRANECHLICPYVLAQQNSLVIPLNKLHLTITQLNYLHVVVAQLNSLVLLFVIC